jgi:hypothetical protein
LKSKGTVLFFLYFHLAWFLCVLAGKAQDNLVSLFFPIPAFAFAIWKQKVSVEILVRSLILICIGIGFDALANRAGWISFESKSALNQEQMWSILPIWLLGLWFLYMAYLPTLAKMFRGRLILGFVMGSVFGPLSYLSGENFDLLYIVGKEEIFFYAIFWGLHFLASIVFLKDSFTTTQAVKSGH